MLVISLLNNLFKNNELFSNSNTPDGIKSLYLYMNGYNSRYYYNWKVTDFIILAVLYIVAFLMSVYSAYLSYTCTWRNSVTNRGVRILTAFVAFMLGPIYLIWYFFINFLGGLC
jgi:hypothetical protein